MNGDGHQDVVLREGEGPAVTVRAHPLADGGFRLDLPGGAATARWDGADRLRLDGVARAVRVVRDGNAVVVIRAGQNHAFVIVDPLAPPVLAASGAERVAAPIPARVARVLVGVGDAVRKGAVLVVLEAMKMELTLTAPFDAVVASLRCGVGDMVAEGTELVTFAAAPASDPPAANGVGPDGVALDGVDGRAGFEGARIVP